MFTKLNELAGKGVTLKSVAFTADGGWTILYDRNGNFSRNAPDEAVTKLAEAAQLDGAGPFVTLTRITLPLIRRILLIAVLFRTLDALRSFDLMFVLTGGGPAGTTETLTVYAYRSLFQAVQLGLGSAVGVVVFALVMAVAWGYLRALRREGLTA